MNGDPVQTEDNFKKAFKYYKSNKPKPSFREIISVEECTDQTISIMPENIDDDPRTELLGLHRFIRWKLYSFRDNPGLLFIKNPFTSAGQRYWIRKCLEEYPKKPNKTNIDVEINIDNWWSECFKGGTCDRKLQKKLRWTTLGYHHNWDTKVYDENKTSFPDDLAELCDVIAEYLKYDKFKAEAAIVNYYHMDSTLSPHTDHSEVNLKAPLFSFSFGQSAIFLIGGKGRHVEPTAILLNSGDIVIMSEEARLCYHAVPKILPATSTPWNDQPKEKVEDKNFNVASLKYITDHTEIQSLTNKTLGDDEWSDFNAYIEQSRINMNVRQVLNENQKNLTDLNYVNQ